MYCKTKNGTKKIKKKYLKKYINGLWFENDIEEKIYKKYLNTILMGGHCFSNFLYGIPQKTV